MIHSFQKPVENYTRNATLLQLGCGTGHATVLIDERYEPEVFKVTDYDQSQVSKANETFVEKYSNMPENLPHP